MRMLGTNLNDALSYDRYKTKAIYIEILKTSKTQVLPIISFGILGVIFGFLIFYMLPLAMISLNMSLLLQIFFLILLGMFIGLCLLALNA